MKLEEDGRIALPEALRRRFGLTPGCEVEVLPEKTGILIRKKGSGINPVDEVYGILKREADTDAIMEAMRGR